MNAQTDVKQMALGVVKPLEIHVHTQALALPGNLLQGIFFFKCGGCIKCQAVAGTSHGKQMTGQVAAVNGRYISGLQNLQRFGLIPIEQMSLVFGHALYGGQRSLQTREHLLRGQPAELSRTSH